MTRDVLEVAGDGAGRWSRRPRGWRGWTIRTRWSLPWRRYRRNPYQSRYRKAEQTLGFLVGKVMKETKGKADPPWLVDDMLRHLLSEDRS